MKRQQLITLSLDDVFMHIYICIYFSCGLIYLFTIIIYFG